MKLSRPTETVKRLTTEQVAKAFRVPPWLIDHSIPVPGLFGRLLWRLRNLR
jgi:hypothetical protein